jgi:PTH1 family peptidyl-tRNA hydrolase
VHLVVGLGNPTARYENTRHNVGFLFLDFLSKDNNAITRSFIKKTSFLSYELKINNTILIKPDTYMNLSGECVSKYMQFYKTNCDDLVVIHDDLDLPFSSLRYKIAGGSGGHNGLKSCDGLIGANYFRIRMGIGRNDNMDVSSFVLSDFTNEQKNILNDEVFPKAKNALYSFIDGEDINKIKSNFSINIKTKEI